MTDKTELIFFLFTSTHIKYFISCFILIKGEEKKNKTESYLMTLFLLKTLQ